MAIAFRSRSRGRIIGCILMTAGVGLFGTFTGFVAAWFMETGEQEQESELVAIRRELRELREALGAERRSSE